ncbi:MAG: hypothetical protein IIB43_09205 [Candidatus Marinimicrobia bacterium]|nr:hypothetical protein [Candidatus Neomarinimicrobiota bacterium]
MRPASHRSRRLILSASLGMLIVLVLPGCSGTGRIGRSGQRIYTPLADSDKLVSDQPLGATFFAGRTTFRLFAPHATRVSLVLLPRYDALAGDEIPLSRDKKGVWSVARLGRLEGQVYGYRVWGPDGPSHNYDPTRIVSDPYSKAVITRNSPDRHSRSLILHDNFSWRGDTWSGLELRDAIIYQLHVRHMTAHTSAGSSIPGSYLALVGKNSGGGLAHLLDLGINAVELLPVIDHVRPVPGNQRIAAGSQVYDQPSVCNHGGYPASHLLAPAAYYASTTSSEADAWIGRDGLQVRELKELVRQLHQSGIAVILDLPFSAVSSTDPSSLLFIDKSYYFQLDSLGRPLSDDDHNYRLRTEAPMVQRLILDALRWWQTEYHIDGFRFPNADRFDEATARRILEQARKVNPQAIIIGDTGGDTIAAERLADWGWAVWNDQYRSAIKGSNPGDGRGFIFGGWSGDNNPATLERYFLGSPRELGGQFHHPGQAVNYLASHTGDPLGDFIRIAGGFVDPQRPVIDRTAQGVVRGKQLAYNTLAALSLLTSQGAVLIPAGQEFAHSRFNAPVPPTDDRPSLPDLNAAAREHDTCYIDWRFKEINRNLFNYYRGLIKLRRKYSALHRIDPLRIQFFPGRSDLGLAMLLPAGDAADQVDLFVILNGHPLQADEFALPAGKRWTALATWSKAGTKSIVSGLSGVISIPPTAGMILMR